MSAVMEPGDSAGMATDSSEAVRVSTRAAAVALAIVVLAFGAAYAIGSIAKKTSVTTPAGQLAPASPLRGQASVQVAVPGAAGAIPALAQVAKAKPAHHAQSSTQTAASVSQSQSTPAQSSSTQSVAQQPVVQQPVQQQPVQQQPVQQQQPVHQPQPQQPVVVVHGG